MLSKKQIETFKKDGLLVVEDVFSLEEIERIRENFHTHLDQSYGISHDKVLAGDPKTLEKLGGARIKSPISNTFYPRWKLLDVNLDERLFKITSQIWAETFAIKAPGFEHPLPKFNPDDGYLYIDRVCYRLPDYLREEGGLSPHLDRNPVDPYLLETRIGLPRWRPIQSFVSLTDQYGGACGGLRCVRGFHHEIDEYFKNLDEKSDGGEFYRLHAAKHKLLYELCQPVDAPAGSFVLWDNRLVHSTDPHHRSYDTREVLYTSFLPAGIPCNDKYVIDQLNEIEKNLLPPCYKKRGGSGDDQGDRDWELNELTSFQKKLLGFGLKKGWNK